MDNSKRILLDGDSNIIEKNLRFVKNDLEEELNSLFGASADNEGEVKNENMLFKIVKPDPGLCIKTYKTIDNEKFFINLCQTDGIPPPENITEEKLKEILISEKPSSYKIPMSISEPRSSKDKNGQSITICDIAINPIYYKKIDKIQLFRDFLITIIFEAIEDKYNIEIKLDSWIILKNRKTMGNLITHRVQNRDVKKVYDSYQNNQTDKKLIEIISSDKKDEKEKIIKINKMTTNEISIPKPIQQKQLINSIKPEYQLVREPAFGDIVERLIASFHLPKCISSNEITLDIGEDRILLESHKRGYIFDGFLGYNISQNDIDAQFNTTTCILTVKLAVC